MTVAAVKEEEMKVTTAAAAADAYTLKRESRSGNRVIMRSSFIISRKCNCRPGILALGLSFSHLSRFSKTDPNPNLTNI